MTLFILFPPQTTAASTPVVAYFFSAPMLQCSAWLFFGAADVLDPRKKGQAIFDRYSLFSFYGNIATRLGGSVPEATKYVKPESKLEDSAVFDREREGECHEVV
jgi:hypothetical protein